MTSRALGHRAPLLWITLPLIAGSVAGSVLPPIPPAYPLALALIATAMAVAAAWPARGARGARSWMAAMLAACFAAGFASCQLARRPLLGWAELPPREIRAEVRVDRTFDPIDPRRRSGLGTILAVHGPLADLIGQRVYFAVAARPHQAVPSRSAVIDMTGVLQPLPPSPAANSFDGYLAGNGINFRFTRGRMEGVVQPQRAYYRFCDRAAERFNVILGAGLEPRQPRLAGLLRAMMLGETRALTPEQHATFMQSGTMHLFAISGLNIAVIAGAIDAILAMLRLPRWARFLTGVPVLWLFVDITGAAPSAVRAFAMAVFFQGAFTARRPANPLAALVGSATVVLLIAPLQLFGASFLMSYVIVLALLTLGLPLSETCLEATALWRGLPKAAWTRWHRWSDFVVRCLVVALTIGVATALVGILTSLQFFGLITPGALVENLVLIPAAILVTVAGFVSLLCGLLGATCWVVLFNHAAAVVLAIIEGIVRWSVHVPGAFMPAHYRAEWIGGATLLVLSATLLFGYAHHWRWRYGGWLPPFGLVILTLVLGVSYG